MADLSKIGLKWGNDISDNLLNSQRGQSHVPHSTTPLPQESAILAHFFFALPPMNSPIPAELKFRENNGMMAK